MIIDKGCTRKYEYVKIQIVRVIIRIKSAIILGNRVIRALNDFWNSLLEL
ncbi:MAG: hypothetical protein LBG92_06285 [Prevotellaceae bacterium]|nr:hypothetical protein [Prevotellaceae bacterium]